MAPISGTKPQPSSTDAIRFDSLPGIPQYGSLNADEQRSVVQSALSTLGRAPKDIRESQMVINAALNPDRVSQLGLAQPLVQSLPQQNSQLALATEGARQQMNQAGVTQRVYQNQAKQALPVLEQALKKASGVGNEDLGQSDLFEAAGLTGFATLAQSLGERMNEIDRKSETFRTVLRDVFSQFQGGNQSLLDNHRNAIEQYESLADQYKTTADQLFQLEKQKQDFENDLLLLNEKARLDAALAARRSSGAGQSTKGAQWFQQQRLLGKNDQQIMKELYAQTGANDPGVSESTFRSEALTYANTNPSLRPLASMKSDLGPVNASQFQSIVDTSGMFGGMAALEPASLLSFEGLNSYGQTFANAQLKGDLESMRSGIEALTSSFEGQDEDTQAFAALSFLATQPKATQAVAAKLLPPNIRNLIGN